MVISCNYHPYNKLLKNIHFSLCTLSIILFESVGIDVLFHFLSLKTRLKYTKTRLKGVKAHKMEKSENIFIKCFLSTNIAFKGFLM